MPIMEELVDLFGPWLPWLFGVGAVLLIGGLLTKELASLMRLSVRRLL